MRIGSWSDPFRIFSAKEPKEAVRSKDAQGDGGSERNSYDPNQTRKDDSEEKNGQPAPEKIEAAIESFRTDIDAQANGLSASVEGTGPGLRIVLKDVNGGVVRQFTGEEFIKLRNAVGRDFHARGKILDQKL